jgi:ERCC4-type nuclease
MVEIIIDNREKNLWNIITDRDLDCYKDKIDIKTAQLDIGDIHIIINNNLYIYERKTTADLLASINDGRYREQKVRLMGQDANLNMIIEGDNIISSKNIKNQKKLTSVYYNSMYRDKINMIFTNGIEETATFILMMAIKIIDKPENFMDIENKREINYLDYCKIKTEKNKNITKDNCYLLQLSQIPQISKEIARKISEVYPNLLSLLMALKDKTEEEQIKILTKIDNIGKTKAQTIINYLL